MTSLDTKSSLAERFRAVRDHTEQLASALTDEDQCVQSMPDASSAKWHRAHTTWFFEQFVLRAHMPGYEGALVQVARRLHRSRPGLAVYPVVADFLGPFALPRSVLSRPLVGFFPGSTIGNLDPAHARQFLARARPFLGGGRFLVGVDLRKDPAILLPAYDDAQGTTAAFNRNLLHRLNREAGADFDPNAFTHRAVWNARESRIEMHLVSQERQLAHVAGHQIGFAAGETIHTENSRKYGVADFAALAASCGWDPARVWTDPEQLFALHLLTARDA